jgi:LuxR family transcriptional regulator, maltose regulon positive regulatory protein
VSAFRWSHQRVARGRLTAPRAPRHTLLRPRLTRRLLLADHYRLLLLQAGTGYGKSTALAALAESGQRLVWYHLEGDDADPYVLLLHLVAGLAAALPQASNNPLALLEEWERAGVNEAVWIAVVDALLGEVVTAAPDEPLLLVLDDAHLLNRSSEALRVLDRLIGRAPANLHVILATRYPLQLPSLVRWRVRGEVLEIGQAELAFTREETLALFREQYRYDLAPAEADLLMEQVEGWPIALPLVWRRLQQAEGSTVQAALGELSGTAGDLFTYLAQEVLQQQPADVRRFLRTTAVLRQLAAPTCDCLRQAGDSGQLLAHLLHQGLFVVERGEGQLRYHHLFRDLLYQQLEPEQRREVHRRAAGCYRAQGDEEEAVYHLLAAEAYEDASALLVSAGRALVQAGRLDRLEGWLGSLPPEVLQDQPVLLSYLGDGARLRSRFGEALGWYQQAEARSRALGNNAALGQALRGQARVYLDTVNPSRAEHLLQEALRLSDGQEDRESRARLLELLAENLLNQGRLNQAQRYQAEARQLREQEAVTAELSLRVLLRTGRLAQVRRLLEERAAVEEQEPVRQPRSHRETKLLLAMVLAFQGEREEALRWAIAGTERGHELNAPFVTAVGLMRQGHAWLLEKQADSYRTAAQLYQQAVAISDQLHVPRLRVEAGWGLTQAFGFAGQVGSAREVAGEAIQIARDAGDEWVEACIRVTLGATYVLAGEDEPASIQLSVAATAFRSCGDPFGEAAVRLWQALLWYRSGDSPRLERDLSLLLTLVEENDCSYLFTRKTLFGPPDPRVLVPLLIYARDGDALATAQAGRYAARLLGQLGVSHLQSHPGYQLRIQTLGTFRLWRGLEEVLPAAWERKKSRQLLQLLLTHRETLLDREQIVEMLWPELDAGAALRDFKIAHTTLCRVLEPGRGRNEPSAYIVRDGSRYGLRPEADLWLDSSLFQEAVAAGDRLWQQDPQAALAAYRQAVELYHGDYLQEYPYAEWCSEERERLLTLYLRTAERVADALLAAGEWEQAITASEALLARDDCWEQAYRVMMAAYTALGNRAQAVRAYQRCETRLQEELGVSPMPETVALLAAIRSR